MSDLNFVPIFNELTTPYPRRCAHRGFSAAAPENTMPAFLAALDIGAQEIEFDLWPTADGEAVSLHDRTLDRVSDGTGLVSDYTLSQLKQMDFGFHHGEEFRGLRILSFEEILATLGKKIIMNVEVKTPDLEHPLPDAYVRKIARLVRQYGCEQYLYFTCGNDHATRQLIELAPDIKLCCSGGGTTERRWQIVDRAIAFGCSKLQFHKACMTEEMIRKAHDHGIYCNVFESDDAEEAARFLAMGVDTILSNNCSAVLPAFKR